MLLDNNENKKEKFDKVVKNKKSMKKKSIALSVIIVACIIVVGIYFCYTKIFIYKNLKVTVTDKSESVYSQKQIEQGLGLKKGTGLYDIDDEKVNSNAKYNLPYIKTMQIERSWPDTVQVMLTYEESVFYIKTGKDLYVLNGSLKVLEKTDDIEKIELKSLIYLELPGVKKCIVGEKIGIDEDIRKIVDNLMSKFDENSMTDFISRIDVKNKFGIIVDYTSKFQIKLGDSSNLDKKVLLAKNVIDNKIDTNVGGNITITSDDGMEATFRKYN